MKHRTLWSIAFAKTVTGKHDLLSNAILGMTAFSPLAHTTCISVCVRETVATLGVFSTADTFLHLK